MSSQCHRFVQNAWKKELCSNCFKPREEHSEGIDNNSRLNSSRLTTMMTKTRILEAKPQGILKGKTSSRGKKKVAFPDSLTEVIGYGGDDFSDSEEFELSESLGVEDDLPDSEEERSLCNLTRANTNFNTVTANLSSALVPDSKKSFASLMLGKPRKDSDGKKKTLLVSVTPFGADTNVPSAKRPSDKKFSNFSTSNKSNNEVVADSKSDVTLKSVNSISEDKILRDRSEKESSHDEVPGLEKIVDMPLITSSNLISVIQKSDSLSVETSSTRVTENYQKSVDSGNTGVKPVQVERKIGITRTPAIKKQKDVEKPKIMSLQGNYKQTLNNKNEYIARTNYPEKDLKSEGNTPHAAVQEKNIENRERTWSLTRGKDVNTMAVQAPEDKDSKNFIAKESSAPFSRELAGEPDGKADEEMTEPPALPQSPPPVESRISEPRNSFLHNVEKKCKPAVPQKPISLPPKGPGGFRGVSNQVRNLRNREEEHVSSNALTTPVISKEEENEEEDGEEDEIIQTSDITGEMMDSELVRSPNKRRMAPKPPPGNSSGVDEAGGSLFARNPGGVNLKSDSPVVREKEKRERASSCSPKFRKNNDDVGSELATAEPQVSSVAPEPAPRRMISLSQDSLANADKIEEKKKARSRFSLKKFLRMGSKKDQVDGTSGIGSRMEDIPVGNQTMSKPRIEIIHPLELDGNAVEVVSREKVPRLNEETKNDAADLEQNQNLSLLSTSSVHHVFARPGKPPPPPRNQSLDDWARLDPANKPARPPPPRTEIKSSKSWQPPSPTSPTSPDSIYANLAAEDVPGEVRSSLAPSKPQRTASMRDQMISQPPVKKRPAAVVPRHQDYEVVGNALSPTTEASNMSNDSHAYECLSSSPECDSSLDLRHGATNRGPIYQNNGKRKSDSSALDPNTEFKYNQQPFSRSTSLPYCGSETESEVYSPYSFYTGDEGPEEDQDWKNSKENESRVGRLRQRRGRSIVHRSLEDNYGAVVVANHEALAQVLEQLNTNSGIPPALRGLKTANLRLSDFKLDQNSSLLFDRRIFYTATWNENLLTVCIALDLALHVSRKEFNLVPIIEFTDTMPDFVAEKINCGEKKTIEATVSILPHLQVSTIGSFAANLKDCNNDESFVREASFVLLQLVNAFKSLQARGVEEAPKNLSNTVLCRENKDACYRLYLLQSLASDIKGERDQEKASLCQCALQALRDMTLSDKLPLVQELLGRERTVTLSQVKSVLEFSLWGPADVPLGGPRDREMTLQRWLDLERATVLHALVRARAPLAVTDEYHLLFLVRTSAKIMCEASILLDAQRRK